MSASDRPAAEGIHSGHFPPSPVEAGHVAPSPRRVRGRVADVWVFDSTRVSYVWEHPYYAQYYVPAADVRADLLVDDGERETTDIGTFTLQTIRVGDQQRPGGARLLAEPNDDALADTYRFEWSAIDQWFEEDEEIFVHPRSPYVRVDALRSSRPVRVVLDGTVLADAAGSVIVFETGLPPRYYLDKTAVDWSVLAPTDTVSECPYKGTTSGYWDARIGDRVVEDVAWGYDFPTRQLQPITGLIAFFDDKVDIELGPASP
ncbi:MAG: DUF427 domain-containing protein [Acidimicrobiales bacterium]